MSIELARIARTAKAQANACGHVNCSLVLVVMIFAFLPTLRVRGTI
jgi:hypothetical protein